MSWVGCVYTIHICIDLTKICFQRCRKCNCRSIGSASS